MNDIKTTNIPSMAVGKMVNQLSEADRKSVGRERVC